MVDRKVDEFVKRHAGSAYRKAGSDHGDRTLVEELFAVDEGCLEKAVVAQQCNEALRHLGLACHLGARQAACPGSFGCKATEVVGSLGRLRQASDLGECESGVGEASDLGKAIHVVGPVDGPTALPVWWLQEAKPLVVADGVDVQVDLGCHLFNRQFTGSGIHTGIVGVNAHRVDARRWPSRRLQPIHHRNSAHEKMLGWT